MTSVYWPK